MTAQVPERIIIQGSPHTLYSQPLYRILASRRTSFPDPESGRTTACYRRYVGTWELVGGYLYLVHMSAHGEDEEPLSEATLRWMLRLIPAERLPVRADWFNGRLEIPMGRRLVYSHHGYASRYERLRVVTCRGGMVVRDRVVDTGAILEWQTARDQRLRAIMDGDASQFPVPPLTWRETSEETIEDQDRDWWPPDYRPDAVSVATG